jgi:hypothetical protein
VAKSINKTLWIGTTYDGDNILGILDLDEQGELYIIELDDEMCAFPIEKAVQVGSVVYDLAFDVIDDCEHLVNLKLTIDEDN